MTGRSDVELMGQDFELMLGRLLPLLQCPISGQPLSFVDEEQAHRLLSNAHGQITAGVTGALVTKNASGAYLIRDRIVDLRPGSAIVLGGDLSPQTRSTESEEVRKSVQQWYDAFGWKKNELGMLNDTAFFSQENSSVYGLYETLSHFAQIERFSSGEFLLDAASGAIAHPEYMAYSYFHRYRVCVDFSETALQEASVKIGDRGFCVLADICQLPFVDNAFDGVISGYTVQHIHRDQQKVAIEELYRVLKPGYRLCILATQKVGKTHRLAIRVGRLATKLAKLLGATDEVDPGQAAGDAVSPPHPLYGHIWSFDWWRDTAKRLSPNSTVHCLRLYSKDEFIPLVRSRRAVRRLRALEMLFSSWLARASSLIAVDIEKPDRKV